LIIFWRYCGESIAEAQSAREAHIRTEQKCTI
jgi:hypothetical protein